MANTTVHSRNFGNIQIAEKIFFNSGNVEIGSGETQVPLAPPSQRQRLVPRSQWSAVFCRRQGGKIPPQSQGYQSLTEPIGRPFRSPAKTKAIDFQ